MSVSFAPFARLLTVCLLSMALVSGLAACGPSDTGSQQAVRQGEAVWPHEESDIPVDPAVTFGRLETGLRYAIMANDTPSNAVSLRLFIDVGSLYETEDERGIAHFLEHMAFKGSENMPGEEVVKFLERQGLAFGPDTNASTGFQATIYQLELPDAGPELLEQGLSVFREYAGRLTLDAELIEKERGVILSEKSVRNTPGLQRAQALYDFITPNARFKDRFPIGTEEVIRSAPRETFVRFYETWYRPDRMMIAVVGDIDPALVEERIKALFADFTRDTDAPVEPEETPVSDRPRAAMLFTHKDLPTQMQVYGLAPPRDLEDTKATRRAALVDALGTSMLSRRLTILSREPDAPFLGAGVSNYDLEDVAQVSVLSITTSPEEWRDALGAGEQALRRALEFGFTQGELEEQLKNVETALKNGVEMAGTRESSGLVGGLVSVAASDAVFNTPQTDLKHYYEAVEDLTLDEVNTAFRAQWEGRAPLLFMSGNLELDDPQADILAAYDAAREVAVTPPEDRGDETFAYTDFGTPGEIAAREEIEDLGITTVRFANNVLLNMKPTDFEDDTIRMSLRLGNGLLSQPREKEGIGILVDYTFTAGGLEAHTLDDIIRLFAGKTVGTDLGVGDDAFVMTGSTDRQDLRSQFNLMAAFLTAPGYRPEALVQLHKGLDIFYETIDATPDGIIQRDVPRRLRSGDTRFGIPEKDILKSRTLEEMMAWLEDPLTKGHIEIGVIGDFETGQVIDAVAATFGALPERNATRPALDEARVLKFSGTDETVILRHGGEPDRAISQIYWPTTDGRDRELARHVTLLSRVFDLRLTETVRRVEGATYSPRVGSAMGTTFPGFGFMITGLDLKPEDTEKFMGVMFDIAEDIRTQGITDDEFERAMKPVLEAAEESLERNPYWLWSAVARAQTRPDLLDDVRTMQADLKAITRADIEAAAKRFLIPEKTARYIVLPPEGDEASEPAPESAPE